MTKKNFEELELWHQTMLELVRRNNPDLDLSTRQMAILLLVYLQSDQQSVKALSSALNISKPAISRALDKLSALGFVKRQQDQDDRRNVIISRTVKGAEYITTLNDIILEKKAG